MATDNESKKTAEQDLAQFCRDYNVDPANVVSVKQMLQDGVSAALISRLLAMEARVNRLERRAVAHDKEHWPSDERK